MACHGIWKCGFPAPPPREAQEAVVVVLAGRLPVWYLPGRARRTVCGDMRFGKDNGKETSREYLKECEVLVLSGKYMDSHKCHTEGHMLASERMGHLLLALNDKT